MSPFINIGETCPPCPIGIDGPGYMHLCAMAIFSTDCVKSTLIEKRFKKFKDSIK